MEFIQLVENRLEQAESFSKFKNLITAYRVMTEAGIERPKLYLVVPGPEMREFNWVKADMRLPNLFVMRPSVFLNSKSDYYLRDDGDRGFLNFTTNTVMTKAEVLSQQQSVLNDLTIPGRPEPSMLFEEFTISDINALEYPIHYRVHTFYDHVEFIQACSRYVMCWITPEGQILASTTKADIVHFTPIEKDLQDLCLAAKTVSLATKLPYIRIDFVLSSRGPVCRGFACVPGDVRSKSYEWFYSPHNQRLGDLWLQAEDKIKGIDNGIDSTSTPTSEYIDTPDDNA